MTIDALAPSGMCTILLQTMMLSQHSVMGGARCMRDVEGQTPSRSPSAPLVCSVGTRVAAFCEVCPGLCSIWGSPFMGDASALVTMIRTYHESWLRTCFINIPPGECTFCIPTTKTTRVELSNSSRRNTTRRGREEGRELTARRHKIPILTPTNIPMS